MSPERPSAAPKPRDPALLDRLADVFRLHGYAGASLSLLADASGLGRASLYHHFPGGKEEMAVAVAEHLASCFRERHLAPLSGPGTPAQRIAGMCKELDAFYERGAKPCIVNAFVMGETSDPLRERVRAAFVAWRDALASVVRDAGVGAAEAKRRAEGALVRIQGSLVCSRALDDPRPFREVLRALPAELTEPG